MATHDYVIANGTGAAVRSDLNNALAAIVSNNSSSSEPSTKYAYQWWADTTTGQLKLRNSANNAWVTIFELDGTMLMEDGTVSAPGLAFASDLNTGFFRSAADKINFATGGVERLEIGSSEVVFNDGSNDVDFRVESNGETHMLFVDGGNDAVGIGTSSPSSKFDVEIATNTGINFTNISTAPIIDFKASSVESAGRIQVNEASGGGVLQFATKTTGGTVTERMRIDSSGGVGIGTSSIDAGKLHILNGSDVGFTPSAAYDAVVVENGNSSQGAVIQLVAATNGVGEIGFSDTVRNRGLISYQHSLDAMLFYTSGTERMRIGPNGLIGINESSPAHELHVSDSDKPEIVAEDTTNNVKAYLGAADTNGRVGTLSNHDFKIQTNDTERMRIRTGTTGGLILAGRSTSVSANATLGIDTASGVAGIVSETGPTSAIDHIRFYNGNGNVGNITTSGGATAYNTSSDYRLKENVVGIADGITRVKQLSPKRFNFIVDADTTVDGFLAHEAQTVVPEAVTGTHDEVDSDGNPEYQGIDPSKLVPLLTAALQEAITKIETLETKVAALEAG